MVTFIVIMSGINEMGFEIPTSGQKILIEAPMNIKIEILNPIE
jgi:hypothetical protein